MIIIILQILPVVIDESMSPIGLRVVVVDETKFEVTAIGEVNDGIVTRFRLTEPRALADEEQRPHNQRLVALERDDVVYILIISVALIKTFLLAYNDIHTVVGAVIG